MIVSVFKDLYKSTDVPFHVPIEKIVNRIKKGTSKEIIDLIRNGQLQLKSTLPCIILEGFLMSEIQTHFNSIPD